MENSRILRKRVVVNAALIATENNNFLNPKMLINKLNINSLEAEHILGTLERIGVLGKEQPNKVWGLQVTDRSEIEKILKKAGFYDD